MAMVEIKKSKAGINGGNDIEAVTTLAAEGGYIDYNADDQKIVLLVGGAAATVKSGNALQGVGDITIPYVNGKTKAVVLESGHFVNVSGANKGRVIIMGTGATIQVIQLP